MSSEIKAAIKKRNTLASYIFSANPEEWIETQAMIKEAKEKKWIEFVYELEADTDVSKVWATIRKLDGSRESDSCPNEILIQGMRSHGGKGRSIL
jgi:hypothetical protein